MNFSFRNLLSVSAFAAITSFSSSDAFAQKAEVTASKIAFDDLMSPQFSGGKQKTFKMKDWLEIEVGVTVQMTPVPKTSTVDRMTVKWFVAIQNPEKAGTFLLLTRDIEHVNIPIGDEVFCAVYLSPASVRRLTGMDRAGKNIVEAVGYEILINGEKVAEDTTKFKVGWWNSPSEKISRSDAVPLLAKSETPFSPMWWDRYAEVLDPRTRQ